MASKSACMARPRLDVGAKSSEATATFAALFARGISSKTMSSTSGTGCKNSLKGCDTGFWETTSSNKAKPL
eukprot:2746613-Pyramimonas_sp.AAC.1